MKKYHETFVNVTEITKWLNDVLESNSDFADLHFFKIDENTYRAVYRLK
jgi:hypothetical protein